MRLIVEMAPERPVRVPVDHQYALMGAIYRLLRCADPDYADALHDVGVRGEAGKRFKPFCFGGLRCARRRLAGDAVWLGPGRVEWQIGSPDEAFLRAFATGLLGEGSVNVGTEALAIDAVRTAPTPDFAEGEARFLCLSPIVASVRRPESEGGGTRYLRPTEGDLFAEAVRGNALSKFRALYGRLPEDDGRGLTLQFDLAYLARNPHGGTKKVTINGIEVVGAMAPFTATGSPELLRLIYDAGVGEKNGTGFGTLERSGH
jgi:CRISPR-associated endoribonuclease Cas6